MRRSSKFVLELTCTFIIITNFNLEPLRVGERSGSYEWSGRVEFRFESIKPPPPYFPINQATSNFVIPIMLMLYI